MATIPENELRTRYVELLRRVEAGEEFTITVAGRPVAQLGPTAWRHWVGGSELRAVWATPAPTALEDDLERFPAELGDPFE